MKKLGIILSFLFCYCISYAQYPITQTLGSDSTKIDGKGAIQSRFINKTFLDTTQANTQRIRQYPGAQIVTLSPTLKFWIRNEFATGWQQASGNSVNIYNSDGTLTADRILSGSEIYSLTLDSLTAFTTNSVASTVIRTYDSPGGFSTTIGASANSIAVEARNNNNSHRSSLELLPDSIRLNTDQAFPSSASLTGAKLLGRTISGGLFDYTGSFQPAGNYITALTGDVTATGPGSVGATLATVNSNVGSFTNPNITVNAKGLITAASNGSAASGVVGVQGIKNINSTTVALEAPAPVWYDPSNLLDKSGNNNHLTLTGSGSPALAPATFGTGIDGYVFESGEHAQTESNRYEIPLGNWTFELRVKREAANLGVQQTVFGIWKDTTVASNKQYRLYFNSSNNLVFQGTSASVTSSNTIADANAHIISIVDSSGFINMYIDGTKRGGPTAMTFSAAASQIPFTLGDITDFTNNSGGEPYSGTIGDFRFSNVMRYTGNSYVTPTVALTVDSVTRALLNFSLLSGTYRSSYSFQSNILTRTGYPQAKGGWANPDGFFKTLDNKFAYSVSAFDSTLWTVYVVTAPALTGPWTVNSVYLQHPYAIEGDLAGNGTVWPWKGKYYHWYHTSGTSALGIRASSSYNLYDSFPQGTTVLNPLSFGWGSFVDPYVRPSQDGSYLEMWYVGSGGVSGTSYRSLLYSTSTDGTTWSPPVRYTSIVSPGFNAAAGEPAVQRIGNFYLMYSDGNKSGSGRNVQNWWSKDRLNWFPSMKAFGPNAGPYLSTFDASIYLDTANGRLIMLAAHSENTQPTQPTASDIGMWYVPLVTLDSLANPIAAIYGNGAANNIPIFNSTSGLGSSPNFNIDTARRSLQLGDPTEAANLITTLPFNLSLGPSISSTSGQFLKLYLYRLGLNEASAMGLGASSSAIDYVIRNGGTHKFWINGTNELSIDGTNMTYDGNIILSPNGTTPKSISIGGFGSGGITFFNSTYGIQQQSSELRLLIPSAAKIGIHNGTSERFSFTESGIANIGTTGGGQINLYGSSSGIVSIKPGAAAAGTFNFNLPVTAGSAGQVLTSQGGGASAMTWTTLTATSPGGSTTNVQFNNAGAFAGDAGLVYGSGTLGVGAFLNLGGTTTPGSAGFFNLASASQYGMYNAAVITPGAGVSASVYNQQGIINEAGSGTHTLLAGMSLVPPTINSGAATVTNTSTFYVDAAPTATVTGRNFALWINSGESRLGGGLSLGVVVSSAGTLTLDNTASVYIFSGTTSTFSLPAVSGTTGRTYFIKNRGSGNLTVDVTGGASDIYDTSAVASIIIAAGAARMFTNDGTFWDVH